MTQFELSSYRKEKISQSVAAAAAAAAVAYHSPQSRIVSLLCVVPRVLEANKLNVRIVSTNTFSLSSQLFPSTTDFWNSSSFHTRMPPTSPRRLEVVKTSMKAYLNDFVDDLFTVIGNNNNNTSNIAHKSGPGQNFINSAAFNSNTQLQLPTLNLSTLTTPATSLSAPQAVANIKTEDDEEKPLFKCEHCPKVFLLRKSLQKHTYNNHQKGTFRCQAEEGCTFVGKLRKDLVKHRYREHRTQDSEPASRRKAKKRGGGPPPPPPPVLKCLKTGCGRIFEKKAQLKRHFLEDAHPSAFDFADFDGIDVGFGGPGEGPGLESSSIGNGNASENNGNGIGGSDLFPSPFSFSPALSVTPSILSAAFTPVLQQPPPPPAASPPPGKPIYRCTWPTCKVHYKSKQKGRVKKHILEEHSNVWTLAGNAEDNVETFIEVLSH